jgi:hypothetical protein
MLEEETAEVDRDVGTPWKDVVLKNLTNAELKEELKNRGLKFSGVKQVLTQRLQVTCTHLIQNKVILL